MLVGGMGWDPEESLAHYRIPLRTVTPSWEIRANGHGNHLLSQKSSDYSESLQETQWTREYWGPAVG